MAIGAILGYPIYNLVRLSFERYGLFELIQRKGEWIGLDNYDSVLHDGCSGTRWYGRSSLPPSTSA